MFNTKSETFKDVIFFVANSNKNLLTLWAWKTTIFIPNRIYLVFDTFCLEKRMTPLDFNREGSSKIEVCSTMKFKSDLLIFLRRIAFLKLIIFLFVRLIFALCDLFLKLIYHWCFFKLHFSGYSNVAYSNTNTVSLYSLFYFYFSLKSDIFSSHFILFD